MWGNTADNTWENIEKLALPNIGLLMYFFNDVLQPMRSRVTEGQQEGC